MSKTAAAAAISTKCGFTNGAAELLRFANGAAELLRFANGAPELLRFANNALTARFIRVPDISLIHSSAPTS